MLNYIFQGNIHEVNIIVRDLWAVLKETDLALQVKAVMPQCLYTQEARNDTNWT